MPSNDNKDDNPTTTSSSGPGIIEKTKEVIGLGSKEPETTETKQDETKPDVLPATGVGAVDATLEGAEEVASKVDDALHKAVLPLEGKDYDDWKDRKEKGELERQKDTSPSKDE